MGLFIELPSYLLSSVISFLPQQDVVSLSQTCSKLYEPCTHKLYRNIVIQRNPLLKEKNVRGRLFRLSRCTVIAGSNNLELPEALHLKLITERILALTQSLQSSGKLSDQIEEITIHGIIENHALCTVLAEFLKVARSMKKITTFHAEDESVRKMFFNGGALPEGVSNFYVDDASFQFERSMHVKELIVSGNGVEIPTAVLEQLESLLLIETASIYKEALDQDCLHGVKRISAHQAQNILKDAGESNAVAFCRNAPHGSLPSLKHMKVQAYHSLHHDAEVDFLPLVQKIPWNSLRTIDLSIGCDNTLCKQKCVGELLDYISLKMISSNITCLKLLILSHCKVHADYNQTHDFDVQWDLAIFGFLTTLMYTKRYSMSHLVIKNKAARSAVYSDGVEGNYHKRIHLYTKTLQNLVAHNLRPIQLELPTFFTTLANYEQPMNNMLWNGCKCTHCSHTLGVLDELLMTHKYITSVWKDLTTCQLMTAIGDRLYERTINSSGGLTAVDWDLHENRFGLPFLCLHHKTFEEGEFENEGIYEEEASEDEAFFDTEDMQVECPLKNEIKFSDVTLSISHYVTDILLRMLNLNRGDAEGIDLCGEENDGGSGDQLFSEITISGIQFAVGRESNGTNWLNCVLT